LTDTLVPNFYLRWVYLQFLNGGQFMKFGYAHGGEIPAWKIDIFEFASVPAPSRQLNSIDPFSQLFRLIMTIVANPYICHLPFSFPPISLRGSLSHRSHQGRMRGRPRKDQGKHTFKPKKKLLALAGRGFITPSETFQTRPTQVKTLGTG
jgi:hypothetical protein